MLVLDLYQLVDKLIVDDFEAGGTGDIQEQPPAVTPQVLPATK